VLKKLVLAESVSVRYLAFIELVGLSSDYPIIPTIKNEMIPDASANG
jgi:hypothetical protein